MSLKAKEIAEFKKQLEALQREIQGSFDAMASDVKTPDETRAGSQHHADEGTNDFSKTISIEVANREIDILRQIDRALEKIEEGTYGMCDLTGEEIARKRLDAIPYATMTRDAQEKLEKGLL